MFEKSIILVTCVLVLALAASTQALPPKKHHWQLEETSGTTAYDSLGSHDGNVLNGTVINQAGPGAPDSKAYSFDGNDDRIDLGSGWVPASGSFAFSVKFKTDDGQGISCDQGHLLSWNDGSDNYRGSVYMTNGAIGLWMKNGPSIGTFGSWADNNWHTMELVRDGNTWTLTIDATSNSTSNSANFPQNLKVTIGGADTTCYGWHGTISDVLYREGTVAANDTDGDDVHDDVDNCPGVSNPDQADSNGNGIGDACDDLDTDDDGIPDDGDGDGIPGTEPCCGGAIEACDDNCIDIPNADQADMDNDCVGDVCDDDADGDGCEADPGYDDCPMDPAKCAEGICGCGVPDIDTDDDDGDGVPNCKDVCPGENDNDDYDEDGVPDACDNCPCDANPDQTPSENPDCGAACYQPGTLIEITGETADSDQPGRGDENAWEIWLISDNTGMHEDGVTHDQCDGENAWLTWAMPSYLTFDLQQVYSLSKMRVWNNHYSPPRGVCHAKIWHSENGSDWTELGTYDWDQPPTGGPFQYDDEVDLGNVSARYVKWTDIQPCDSGRTQVGLGEVIFYTSEAGGCTDDADGDGSETCLDCDDDPEACGAACGPDLTEDTANANCTDGYDNDCDGLVDHDDPGCGCACPGDVDGDGWMSPKDVSDLVNELLPHASNSYWLEVADPPDCGDVDEDDWKSPKDVSDLVNTLLPHASNSYWLLCP